MSIRKDLTEQGLDAGAETIRWHLLRVGSETVPSVATIWRILVRRGFVVPDPSKRPRSAMRSFVAERANECWQIDATHWELAEGRTVEIINVIDDCTRVHHNTVDKNGYVEIPGPAAISIGSVHAGHTATTIRTGNHAHVFIANQLVRQLEINPNRRTQPLYDRPGRP